MSARWPTSTGSSTPRPSTASRSSSLPVATSCAAKITSSWWGSRVWENPDHRNTPLVTQECEGQVTVTDPTHPLFGRVLTLFGAARLPGHVRYCHVEVLPGQYGYVAVASTNLSTRLRPEPTVLTLRSLEELVATFQALPAARRRKNATARQPRGMGSAVAAAANRGNQGHRSHSHGGNRT